MAMFLKISVWEFHVGFRDTNIYVFQAIKNSHVIVLIVPQVSVPIIHHHIMPHTTIRPTPTPSSTHPNPHPPFPCLVQHTNHDINPTASLVRGYHLHLTNQISNIPVAVSKRTLQRMLIEHFGLSMSVTCGSSMPEGKVRGA